MRAFTKNPGAGACTGAETSENENELESRP